MNRSCLAEIFIKFLDYEVLRIHESRINYRPGIAPLTPKLVTVNAAVPAGLWGDLTSLQSLPCPCPRPYVPFPGDLGSSIKISLVVTECAHDSPRAGIILVESAPLPKPLPLLLFSSFLAFGFVSPPCIFVVI